MASLRIKPSVYHSIFDCKKSHQFPHSNPSVFLPNPLKKATTPKGMIYASSSREALELTKPSEFSIIGESSENGMVSSSRVDQWMEESAGEIVRSLKQAPFLVHVYDSDDGEADFKTEKAVLENWPVVKGEWESGETKSPDGLIFVEELVAGDDSSSEKWGDAEEGVTRAFGIVVQGKGVECGGPACYLLKTSRVGGGLGLGMFCTHFCLMRVKSFSQTALMQFKDSWLLR